MKLKQIIPVGLITFILVAACGPESTNAGSLLTDVKESGPQKNLWNKESSKYTIYPPLEQLLKNLLNPAVPVKKNILFLTDTWGDVCKKLETPRLYRKTLKHGARLIQKSSLTTEPRRSLLQGFYKRLGENYEEQHLYMQAISAWEKARQFKTSKRTEEEQILPALAALYEKVGLYDKALKIHKRERPGKNGESRQACRQIATLHCKMGNPQKAIRLISDGRDSTDIRWLVRLLWSHKYLSSTERISRKALNEDLLSQHERQEVKLLLARTLRERQQRDEALQWAAKAFMEIPPDASRPRLRRLLITASFIAETHAQRGTLDKAIAAARRHLQGAEPSHEGHSDKKNRPIRLSDMPAVALSTKEDVNTAQRLRLLLFHFYAEKEHVQKALRICRQYSKGRKLKGGLHRKIRKYARKHFQNLLQAGKTAEAEQLLEQARERIWKDHDVECANYHLFREKYGRYTATGYFIGITAMAAEDDRHLYDLARTFHIWGKYEQEHILWRQILSNQDRRPFCEGSAHVRVATSLYDQGEYKKALRHLIKFKTNQVGAVSPRKAFLRFRFKVHYHAAGEDADVIIPYIKKGRFLQRQCALQFLGTVGSQRHTRILRRYKRHAPPVLRPHIEDAIARIETRNLTNARGSMPAINAEKDLREWLRNKYTVKWIRKDPVKESQIWAALDDHFLIACDLKDAEVKRCADKARWLVGSIPQAKQLVFTEQHVWVGTDKGLLAYRRSSGTWSLYAVDGRLTDYEVQDVTWTGNRVRIEIVTAESKSTAWFFHPQKGTWEKSRR